ncbi:2218_t:CDS:2 [Acaulospora morrowiae]|uniref:2218_t:CDS:1 n=1 Tax=Acaulospora morrowiae TaxID=94023 RepID=A0A9N9A7D0_9GLOM|nr:2218_t:CDS:2 [Acaulospora morrowiae]
MELLKDSIFRKFYDFTADTKITFQDKIRIEVLATTALRKYNPIRNQKKKRSCIL